VSLTTLERVAAGQAGAIEECLQKYSGLIWSLARKLCPNITDAEDAVQEIFVEVWKHADRFDATRASETTYIATIARRRLIDRYRRRSRQIETAAIDAPVEGPARPPEEHAEVREEAARARHYMTQLRPAQQQVLEMSMVDGLSQTEIADLTKMPLGTVKTHARRGLLRLRELLEGEPMVTAKGQSQ
jgi:RNA polymerase sigma-70 factor (ECF subfamily)